MSKPKTCLNPSCSGNSGYCDACANRSELAKRGYALISAIEDIKIASIEQTRAVTMASDFMRFTESEINKQGTESEGAIKNLRWQLKNTAVVTHEFRRVGTFQEVTAESAWEEYRVDHCNGLLKSDFVAIWQAASGPHIRLVKGE